MAEADSSVCPHVNTQSSSPRISLCPPFFSVPLTAGGHPNSEEMQRRAWCFEYRFRLGLSNFQDPLLIDPRYLFLCTPDLSVCACVWYVCKRVCANAYVQMFACLCEGLRLVSTVVLHRYSHFIPWARFSQWHPELVGKASVAILLKVSPVSTFLVLKLQVFSEMWAQTPVSISTFKLPSQLSSPIASFIFF